MWLDKMASQIIQAKDNKEHVNVAGQNKEKSKIIILTQFGPQFSYSPC